MFNTLERALLMRKLSQNSDRIKRLESLLQGQPLSVVKIADASITEAKIGSLAVSKLTTGQLAVGTLFDIGDVIGGNYIRAGLNANTILKDLGLTFKERIDLGNILIFFLKKVGKRELMFSTQYFYLRDKLIRNF